METANIRAPFKQIGKITEKLRKNTNNQLQMTPKWLQNGAQSGPKTIQGALRTENHKLRLICSIFGRPGAPKWRPKITKKLEKPDSAESTFLFPQKTMISKTHVLLYFPSFGNPKTLEIKPKRCTVCKNRGSALFDRSAHSVSYTHLTLPTILLV